MPTEQYDEFDFEDKPISDELLAKYNEVMKPVLFWQFVGIVKLDHVMAMHFATKFEGKLKNAYVAVTSDGEWNEAGHLTLLKESDVVDA